MSTPPQNPNDPYGYGTGGYDPNSYGQTPYGQDPYPNQQYGQAPYDPSQGYGQSPYGADHQYGLSVPAPDNPKSTQAMIFGIVGLLCCGFVGIVGIVLGVQARREIEATGGRQGGSGKALAGIICGTIGIVLTIFGGLSYAIAVTHAGSN